MELNPSYAAAYSGLGSALTHSGRAAEAIADVDKAMRLSPHDPLLWGFMTLKALALVHTEQYEEAIDWAQKAIRQPNAEFLPFVHQAVALAQLDRTAEARSALDEALRKKPDLSLSFVERSIHFVGASERERYFSGLRKAGLPE